MSAPNMFHYDGAMYYIVIYPTTRLSTLFYCQKLQNEKKKKFCLLFTLKMANEMTYCGSVMGLNRMFLYILILCGQVDTPTFFLKCPS